MEKLKVRIIKTTVKRSMTLHNFGENTVYFKDYGFIDDYGNLLSLSDHTIFSGGLSKGNYFQIGPLEIPSTIIGSYAITTTQRFRAFNFDSKVPGYRRVWIKLKVWWKPTIIRLMPV